MGRRECASQPIRKSVRTRHALICGICASGSNTVCRLIKSRKTSCPGRLSVDPPSLQRLCKPLFARVTMVQMYLPALMSPKALVLHHCHWSTTELPRGHRYIALRQVHPAFEVRAPRWPCGIGEEKRSWKALQLRINDDSQTITPTLPNARTVAHSEVSHHDQRGPTHAAYKPSSQLCRWEKRATVAKNTIRADDIPMERTCSLPRPP